jgi:phosphoglucosamine mutase
MGRDTRLSGSMLEGALSAGLCSAGVHVRRAGIVPTPGVAWLAMDSGAKAGAMISASHNPVADNGIKFFSDRGLKITATVEDEIEALMERVDGLPVGEHVGVSEPLPGGVDRYVGHLVDAVGASLEGLKIVLDCAFGAAWEVAPRAFREAGATIVEMNAEPDGARINVDCGSTSLEGVVKRVITEGADLGLAFDGDADRVLAVDERGDVVDGDGILAVSAIDLKERGELANDLVVATVMSNLGFVRSLEERGIDVFAAPVGDKHVAEAMAERGATLGGEQSGHVILGKHTTTGDGVLTGLEVASTVVRSGRPLSALAHVFEPFPQVLINVPVHRKGDLETSRGLWDEVHAAEERLGDAGRVLLRASGTEPVVRVMVEAADESAAGVTAESLVEAVKANLG